jgi:hypothetical protein
VLDHTVDRTEVRSPCHPGTPPVPTATPATPPQRLRARQVLAAWAGVLATLRMPPHRRRQPMPNSVPRRWKLDGALDVAALVAAIATVKAGAAICSPLRAARDSRHSVRAEPPPSTTPAGASSVRILGFGVTEVCSPRTLGFDTAAGTIFEPAWQARRLGITQRAADHPLPVSAARPPSPRYRCATVSSTAPKIGISGDGSGRSRLATQPPSGFAMWRPRPDAASHSAPSALVRIPASMSSAPARWTAS